MNQQIFYTTVLVLPLSFVYLATGTFVMSPLAIPINTCCLPQSIKCRCYTNRYGFQCCNRELELYMELTINNPFDPKKWLNLSKDCISDQLQKGAQQLFKKSFEVVVSDAAFCGKNSFRGDLYCKIRTYDGKVAQVYATPVPYSLDPCCPNRPLSMQEVVAQRGGQTCSIDDIVTEM